MRAAVLAIALGFGRTAPPTVTAPTPTTTAPPASAATTPSPSSAAFTFARPLPLFDAHIHYSADAWSILTPQQALERLRSAGVQRAIVSGSPDEGTMRLYELAPDAVVPFLRPYRGEIGPSTWARDGTTVAYVKARYRPGVHRGIGEVHLAAGDAGLPVVRAVIDFGVAEKLWLEIHTDARGIDEVMRGPASGTRVIWAHAGQTASPLEIGRLLERYPTLWVELSGRSDIASEGQMGPGWRDLFRRYPDRFMAGSDTWINTQWERLPEIEAANQAWLALLPPDVGRKIATGNAEVLFPRSN